MSVERPQRGSSPPASGGGEERWADALRQAQAELDELRDRHAQERLLLEVQYQQSISGGQPLPSLPHLLHDEPLSPTAAAEPALDSATLQQRCMQLEARLTVCTEEVRLTPHSARTASTPSPTDLSPCRGSSPLQLSALRQSNSRLLSSESKYRERADQLQSQLTLAHSSHHSQQQTRSQIAALTAELQSMEAQMQAMRGEVERREEEMRRVVGEVEERLRRKKDGWRREREELTRSYDERERTLQVLAAREVERKEEEAKKAEAELKEVSAKHRQEWQTKEEQLFRIKDENLSAAQHATPRQHLRLSHSPAVLGGCVGLCPLSWRRCAQRWPRADSGRASGAGWRRRCSGRRQRLLERRRSCGMRRSGCTR